MRVNPTSARAHFHLGNVQFALQQYAAAEASFNMALKACLNSVWTLSCHLLMK